ncbi:hypothetical protein B4589_011815 [Halolamina sp. CBA1230]|uniref:hypothetical protein n=1 Tax=Halolamina sp. CBA1230 TaxID=1853690 RepID=UPI0009A1950A|nr:hypothetical protein [Halolamina sp. CBA1230]QKY21028.1 hypothetical protein B4589_011815 [Halolamina sp. CBA1230]
MSVADTVATVFAPELFVLLATLLLLGYERRGDLAAKPLAARLGVVAGAWVVAFAVYQGGPELLGTAIPGGDDFFAAVGLIAAFAGIALAWRRFEWGSLLPPYAALLVATSLLHLVVVPLWDASSHVIYAAVPAGALTAVDRRFAPLFLVAPLLIWSRIATDAHTVDEAVGGLVVAAAVLGSALALGRLPGEEDDGVDPL